MGQQQTSSSSPLLHCPPYMWNMKMWLFDPDVIAEHPLSDPVRERERSGVPPFAAVWSVPVQEGEWRGPWRRGSTGCYTTFSMPGRGCCIGTGGSGPPACWASCKTGMLHRGHTFLTSNHLMRHLWGKEQKKMRSWETVVFSVFCWGPFLPWLGQGSSKRTWRPSRLWKIPLKKLNCNESYNKFQVKFDGLYDSVHKRAVSASLSHL